MALLVQTGHQHQHQRPPFRIPGPVLPQPGEPYPVPHPLSGPPTRSVCARIAAGRRTQRRTHTRACSPSGSHCLRPSSSKGTTGPKNVAKASYIIRPSLPQLRSNLVQRYLENEIRDSWISISVIGTNSTVVVVDCLLLSEELNQGQITQCV